MFSLSCPVLACGSAVEAGTIVEIHSPNIISRTDREIQARYTAQDSKVSVENGKMKVETTTTEFILRTNIKKPKKLGLMLVGWGGNNGSTLTASLLANKLGLSWESRRGTETANFLGSLVMASTVPIGMDATGHEVTVKMHDLVPFADPCDIVVGGWDISSMSIGDALVRSRVLEPDLIRKVKPQLDKLKPLPSIFDPSFVASNQASRADNVLEGSKHEQIDQICKDIQKFRVDNDLFDVIVMWTANTERYCEFDPAVHNDVEGFEVAMYDDHPEISPSSMFAYAAITMKCPFINGSPQNTLIPAIVAFAQQQRVSIAGDDFKSGQTKIKSVLVDFLISSGIKPLSIVSYNHLGNNDGRNLAEAAQFRSKQVSKSGVVEDMVASNQIMFPVGKPGPDHTVVIEYVPAVGDSKKAMDEYESEIFMGGRNTLVMHNTCEDSLLATPLMLDLVLLMEFFQRVTVARPTPEYKDFEPDFEPMHEVTSLLAFCLKAPVYPDGVKVTNALMKQRRAIEGILRACVGLPPVDDLHLSQRLKTYE